MFDKSLITLAALAIVQASHLSAQEKPPLRIAPNLACKVLHPLGYGAVLAQKAPQIDGKLDSLQIDEQLRLFDHVVDYVYVNFKNLQKLNAKPVVSDLIS